MHGVRRDWVCVRGCWCVWRWCGHARVCVNVSFRQSSQVLVFWCRCLTFRFQAQIQLIIDTRFFNLSDNMFPFPSTLPRSASHRSFPRYVQPAVSTLRAKGCSFSPTTQASRRDCFPRACATKNTWSLLRPHPPRRTYSVCVEVL